MQRKLAQPEAQGLPVDQDDDFQGDERIFDGEPEEPGSGECLAFSREGTEKDLGAVRAGAVVDMDVEVPAGDFEFEVEVQVEGAVGGDVEKLGGDETPGSRRGGGLEEIGFHLAEGVAHLNHGAERLVGGAVCKEIEGDGIENIAEDAGERDQANLDVPWIHRKIRGIRLVADPRQDVFLDGGLFEARESQVVAVAESVEVPAVVGKAADPGGGGIDFVEIEGKEEDVIPEVVDLRGEPPVHDAAFVKAGGGAVFG